MGLRPAYENTSDCILRVHRKLVHERCQKYCDDIGLGLTITDTTFIYTDGDKPGVIVGLINYPRFPASKEHIQEIAFKLAEILLKDLQQERLSIMFPDVTIMIEKSDYEWGQDNETYSGENTY